MGILSSIENRIIVESFTDEETGAGVRFSVVDYVYPFCHKNDIRRIEFENEESYLYSSIYLSDKRDFQPMYPCAQRIIDCFFGRQSIGKALVLGCAGCTFPRFLVNRYPQCRVTGVEYSARLINIAKKHFFNSEMQKRFEIINDDAFMFVKEAEAGSYSLVFVDLFVAEKIHSSVLSPDFAADLCRICGENSVCIFNLFGLAGSSARRLAKAAAENFDAVYLIEDYRKYFLALIKTNDMGRLPAFEKRVKRFAEIDNKILAGEINEAKPPTDKKNKGL